MVEQRRIPMAEADPYLLFGLLGKQVIHPGGRQATEELFALAELAPGQHVLDIGCGAGKTAIEMATRFEVTVTAADISVDMRDRAVANVENAGVRDRVSVESADICGLPYEDGQFDRVVAEAVTMFVDRDLAISELVRVCRPGGLVLATEFHMATATNTRGPAGLPWRGVPGHALRFSRRLARPLRLGRPDQP